MDFARLVREHGLLDIVTVDGLHYAIAAREPLPNIPGCTVIAAAQLTNYMQAFLRTGFSQRYHQQYALLVGMRAWVLFTYDVSGLPASRKQAFSHSLSGTASRRARLVRWGGQKVGRSAFMVPVEAETEASAALASWAVPYRSEVILRGE